MEYFLENASPQNNKLNGEHDNQLSIFALFYQDSSFINLGLFSVLTTNQTLMVSVWTKVFKTVKTFKLFCITKYNDEINV